MPTRARREFWPSIAIRAACRRNWPPSESRNRRRSFANRLAWIFKKVDSVLRGHPRAEIEAILGVTGQPRALLIPANPSRGRVIVGGKYLMDGVLLDKILCAHDPEFPRPSADLALYSAMRGTIASICSAADGFRRRESRCRTLRRRRSRAVGHCCDTPRSGAGAADFCGPDSVPLLGSAIDAENGRQFTPAEPALLVCGGSPAAWTWAQSGVPGSRTVNP